jgi:hypothetical protein
MADNKVPLLTPKEKEMQIIPYDFKGKAIVPVSDPMDIDPPPKVKQVFFIRTFITIPEHIRNRKTVADCIQEIGGLHHTVKTILETHKNLVNTVLDQEARIKKLEKKRRHHEKIEEEGPSSRIKGNAPK